MAAKERQAAASKSVRDGVENLRRKLDKPFEQKLLHTVVGTGYRFGADDG